MTSGQIGPGDTQLGDRSADDDVGISMAELQTCWSVGGGGDFAAQVAARDFASDNGWHDRYDGLVPSDPDQMN